MEKNKKTLVTGGNGLVGSCFNQSYKKVSSKDCDLTSFESTKKLFQKEKPNVVIHTAARVGGLGSNMADKSGYFFDNIRINNNVINNSLTHNVDKLVCFLTTCIFPNDVQYPLKPEYLHDGPPHESNYGYAYAKRMGEIYVRTINEQYNKKYFSVVPTNIFGPNDNFSLVHGHVVPALIHKMYIAQKESLDFTVWGSGKPLREFVLSRDVAKIVESLIDKYEETDPVIISSSEEISIADLVEMLVDIFNFKGKVVFDKDKPDGQFRKPTDNSKLKELLPDFKFTPVRQALEETVEWFINNYEICRK
jgi:GDP-L-fucose synthase|tara:strand:+ start:841 stop:1758 length:918 start_codon:yes stop_codon:yes gene_type:complete